MAYFFITSFAIGVLVIASLWITFRAAQQPRTSFETPLMFRTPRFMGMLATISMAAISLTAVAYAYYSLQNGSTYATASLSLAASIAAALSYVSAIEFSRAYVTIDGKYLIRKSLSGRIEVDISDVADVFSHYGYVWLKLKDGRLVVIAGGMGWNSEFTRCLRESIVQHQNRTLREN